MHPLLRVVVLGVVGCANETETDGGPAPEGEERTGVDGCNCAGAAPVMRGPDQVAYPFQSIVGYYYKHLEATWMEAEAEPVLTTSLAPHIEETSEAFVAWQAKSIQILADRGTLGYSHRFYRGIFGLANASPSPGLCSAALDEDDRRRALLAHIGLSQAGVCGENDDGTTKFWQVNHIALLAIGDVIAVEELVASGLAAHVQLALASRCILPTYAFDDAPTPVVGSDESDPVIPCDVAFTAAAVTEAVVLPVPSSAVVAGTPLGYRGFTAAGTATLPNGLATVRSILRDQQLRAMFAVGLPRFQREPQPGPPHVRLVGHRIGPARQPSSVLLPDERAWVDQSVGTYDQQCCRLECTRAIATGTTGPIEHCQQRCIDEGACASTTAASGLVIMLSAATTKECFGSCPEPATGAPATPPVCAP